MNRDEIIEIMQDEEYYTKFPEGCNVYAGLQILTRYLPKAGIEAAEHDIIFSSSVSDLVESGITKEDLEKLREMNWMYDPDTDSLACFV